jgi:hypothetical protein
MARHPLPFEDPRGSRGRANRTGGTLAVRLTVGFGATSESVSFDNAREPATLAGSGNVHMVANLEHFDRQLVALVQVGILGAKLT